jgi:transposase
MYLRKTLNKKTGRIFLSIVKGYRDPDTKKVKQKLVEAIGYLDELEKDFDDPIEHFKELAVQMTNEEKKSERPLTFTFNANEKIISSSTLRKNLGFLVLSYFYHKLNIDKFFINRQRNLNIEYSLNNIFQMLAYSRVLFPCSKKKSYENMDYFFADFDFSLDDVYRALDYFNFYKNDLLLHTHEMVRMMYGRDMSNVYYDVTNYYFEIDEPDELRKKGVSKEHRPNPIVQMGLLIDNSGLPITYRLFEGNTNDCETLMPVLDDLKNDYGLKRIIVVADKGMNTGENIAYNILHKNGYVYSQTVRGANADLKDFVLSDKNYVVSKDGFKIKSRVVTTDIWVTNASSKKVKVPIEQKQVVFYSPEYAKKAHCDREKAIEKAKKIIGTKKNGKLPAKGSFKYIISTPCDTETGELYECEDIHYIDNDKIQEEMKFDGYYAIITSELNMSDSDILDAYRALWKIEESFKITKSELKTRPVHMSTKDHIEAHFLTCFFALLLIRLVEMKTEHKYSAKTLINEMKNITGTYLDENYYMLDHYTNIVRDLGDTAGIDFTKRFMTLGEIKKILAETKK